MVSYGSCVQKYSDFVTSINNQTLYVQYIINMFTHYILQ